MSMSMISNSQANNPLQLERFEEYLGCGQRTITVTPAEVQQRLEHIHPVRVDPGEPEAAADIKQSFASVPVRVIAYEVLWFFCRISSRKVLGAFC